MKRLCYLFSSIVTIFLVMVMLFAVLSQNVSAAESSMSETDFQETEEESGNDNNQDTVTLTFHANGGYFPSWEWDEETQSERLVHKDIVSGEYEIGSLFYLCWEAPLHDNETMVLLGWAEDENATEPSVFDDGETTVDGLSNLWAVWAEGIPVTYHANKDGLEFYDDDGSLHTEITRYYEKGTLRRLSILEVCHLGIPDQRGHFGTGRRFRQIRIQLLWVVRKLLLQNRLIYIVSGMKE